MPALILDMDGVICNSVEEVFIVSALAHFSIPTQRLSQEFLTQFKREFNPKLRASFLEKRGYVRPARHFYLLWKWISDFSDRKFSQEQFEELESQYAKETQEFFSRFLELRACLMEKHQKFWHSLTPLYADVKQTWNQLQKQLPIYVVTTKDKRATEEIMRENQLEASGVFPLGSFKKKSDAIMQIAAETSLKGWEMVFIDDHPSHLQDVLALDVKCFQASWGYSPSDPAFKQLKCFADIKNILTT